MSRGSGKSAKVYMDQYDYSGRTNAIELLIDNVLPAVTAPNDLAETLVEAKLKSSLKLNGFFDGVANQYDQHTWAAIDGNEHKVGAYPGTLAPAGAIGYELLARIKDEPRTLEVEGAILLNVTWQGDNIVRSTVLYNGAITATGAKTGQNVDASTAGQIYVAVLRVLEVTGAGSITVKVQESSDNGVGDPYADLITFDAATGISVQRKTVTSATEAYKRINISAFSGFTSVTVMVAVGIEKGT